MILAAGLGTRMRPLSSLRPKPILPVRGIPLLAYPLAWLAHHGVDEVIVNLHHFADATRAVAEVWAPPGLRVHFSEEPLLLDTGGGIRRAAAFLRESDPSLVIAGDMLLDLDLAPMSRAIARAAMRRRWCCARTRAPSASGRSASTRRRGCGASRAASISAAKRRRAST